MRTTRRYTEDYLEVYTESGTTSRSNTRKRARGPLSARMIGAILVMLLLLAACSGAEPAANAPATAPGATASTGTASTDADASAGTSPTSTNAEENASTATPQPAAETSQPVEGSAATVTDQDEGAATATPEEAAAGDSDDTDEADAADEADEADNGAATPTNGTAVLTPLIIQESPTECEIESNLDLAGYLNIEERMGCAQAPAKFDPVAINEFGTGPDYDRFMLWFGSEGNIYALLPDGTYEVFTDTWQEGDPTFTCNPLEGDPQSPPLPRRGFGQVWCENPELQEAMGTIEREERLCQHAVDQRFAQGRLLACFEDATVRYFRILDDGTWDVTTQ